MDEENKHVNTRQGGLFSDLRRRLIVAAQRVFHKIDNTALNKPQEFVKDDDDTKAEYVDPAELPPMGDEELFTAKINKMVAKYAPRIFALCEQVGDLIDPAAIAWGMAFNDHAEVVCTTHGSARGVFNSAEQACRLLSADDKVKLRVVWVPVK